MNHESARLEGREALALEGPDTAARGRRRWVLGAVLVLLALAGAWWAFSGRGDGAAPKAEGGRSQVPSVTVVAPGRQPVDRVISATGQLAAKREMPVGVAGEGGMITRVLVEPGQWVGAGQVLATVDRSVQQQSAASLAAQVNVARADADLAQAELQRASALVDRGFISKADLQRRTATRDAALSRVRVAQAALAEQRARNGRLDIRAPAAGLVLTRQAEPGQIVSSASGVLFRMAMGGQMEMQARLAESDLVSLRPGARATVTPVGSDRRFAGQVWQVSPVIDQQTRQGIARIQLRFDPALRPGGFAAASIVGGTAFQPLLPDSAVQSDGRGSFVYIVDAQGKVRRRDVQLGQVSDTGVAVAGGLDGSERVVLSAGGFLTEGQTVKPVPQKQKAG
jgi:RND family efflux transporter MFP subunit